MNFQESRFDAPSSISSESSSISLSGTFADALFWVAVVACLVAQIGIMRSALRIAGSADGAGVHGSRAREIAWTIVPALGLALVLFFTWQEMKGERSAPDAHHHHSSIIAS